MYQVQMEFIPGNNMIWVARLTAEDPIYEYTDETEAINKANELQSADSSGRLYRVVYL
jgi:hypothetical protein